MITDIIYSSSARQAREYVQDLRLEEDSVYRWFNISAARRTANTAAIAPYVRIHWIRTGMYNGDINLWMDPVQEIIAWINDVLSADDQHEIPSAGMFQSRNASFPLITAANGHVVSDSPPISDLVLCEDRTSSTATSYVQRAPSDRRWGWQIVESSIPLDANHILIRGISPLGMATHILGGYAPTPSEYERLRRTIEAAADRSGLESGSIYSLPSTEFIVNNNDNVSSYIQVAIDGDSYDRWATNFMQGGVSHRGVPLLEPVPPRSNSSFRNRPNPNTPHHWVIGRSHRDALEYASVVLGDHAARPNYHIISDPAALREITIYPGDQVYQSDLAMNAATSVSSLDQRWAERVEENLRIALRRGTAAAPARQAEEIRQPTPRQVTAQMQVSISESDRCHAWTSQGGRQWRCRRLAGHPVEELSESSVITSSTQGAMHLSDILEHDQVNRTRTGRTDVSSLAIMWHDGAPGSGYYDANELARETLRQQLSSSEASELTRLRTENAALQTRFSQLERDLVRARNRAVNNDDPAMANYLRHAQAHTTGRTVMWLAVSLTMCDKYRLLHVDAETRYIWIPNEQRWALEPAGPAGAPGDSPSEVIIDEDLAEEPVTAHVPQEADAEEEEEEEEEEEDDHSDVDEW